MNFTDRIFMVLLTFGMSVINYGLCVHIATALWIGLFFIGIAMFMSVSVKD
jgi:hypothetical protein